MRWKQKAAHVVKRVMADGTVKEYSYVRRRPPQQIKAPDSLAVVIEQWQNSPSWRKLAPATQVNYVIYLKPLWRIGHVAIRDLRRADLLALVDQIAQQRGDGAACGFARVVSRLMTFALDRGLIEHTPAQLLAKDLARGELKAWTNDEAQ